jgi:hypothetical protein
MILAGAQLIGGVGAVALLLVWMMAKSLDGIAGAVRAAELRRHRRQLLAEMIAAKAAQPPKASPPVRHLLRLKRRRLRA